MSSSVIQWEKVKVEYGRCFRAEYDWEARGASRHGALRAGSQLREVQVVSLPTFLREHILADKGCCFMISALLMKLSFGLDYLLDMARLGRQSSWFWQVEFVGIRMR